MVSICEICWDEDHEDESKHTVITMKKYLQPQEKIRKKLRSSQSEFTKMTELLGHWSKLVDQFQSVERMHDEVMKSRTPNEVETKSNDMKVKIDHQKEKLKSFKSDILTQFGEIENAIESIFIADTATKAALSGSLNSQEVDRPSNAAIGTSATGGLHRSTDRSEAREEVKERALVGVREIADADDEIHYCLRVVYNSETRELLCLNSSISYETEIRVFGVTGGENDQLELKRKMNWESLRGIESTLFDICIDETSNTLYGVVIERKGIVNRVEKLDQMSLKKEAVLDTQNVPNGVAVYWFLASKSGTLAIAVQDKDKWHSVIIYKNSLRLYTVPLNIKLDGYVYRTGSVLVINEAKLILSCGTSAKKIAVVSLESKPKQQNYTQASSFVTKSSTTADMKVIYLTIPGIDAISSLMWTPLRHPLHGFLWVGDKKGKPSRIYKVDIERVSMNVEHELEFRLRHVEGVLPLQNIHTFGQIDHSTVFALKVTDNRFGNLVLLKLEFSNT